MVKRRTNRVNAADLERWAAEHPTSPALLELIARLLQAEQAVTGLRRQGHAATRDSGWDLVVTSNSGSGWVPEGRSGWIVSAAVYSAKKIEADLARLLSNPSPLDPNFSTFVFVTARRWSGKSDWLAAARRSGRWKEVLVYDTDDLVSRLSQAPEVQRWFAATQLLDPEARAEGLLPQIPWDSQSPKREAGPLTWLSWATRASPLLGRLAELNELLDWARDGEGIRFRFLVGEGGIGKTRLAFEVADALQREGWAAGTVPPDGPLPLDASAFGCFLIFDRPEEHQAAAARWFEEIARQRDVVGRSVRVLFVSRWTDRWGETIERSGAKKRRDPPLLLAAGIEVDTGWELFCTVRDRIAQVTGTRETHLALFRDFHDFSRWQARDTVNARALSIMVVAALSVLEPEHAPFDRTVGEAMVELADRERARLQELGVKSDLPPWALERLNALAAVGGGLGAPVLEKLSAADLRLGLGSRGIDWRPEHAGFGKDGDRRSEPSIAIAAFVTRALEETGKRPPGWLWAVMEGAEIAALARVARLIHDANVTLGLKDRQLAVSLADMVRGRPERANRFVSELLRETPIGLTAFSTAVWETLAEHERDPENRSNLLHNLAANLLMQGDADSALTAIRESVYIIVRLADSRSGQFAQLLPFRFEALSACLAATGDDDEALDAAHKAVDLYRRLAAEDPSTFGGDLAGGLVGLAGALSNTGDLEGAVSACREAVAILRQSSEDDSVAHKALLARSLTALSTGLLDLQEPGEALAAAVEAVEIRRRLAAESGPPFAADLSASLIGLSNCLVATGDAAGAAPVCEEAVTILRPLAAAEPERFASDLVQGLNGLSNCLAILGNRDRALLTAFEAGRLFHEPSPLNPTRLAPLYAATLTNLGKRHSDMGNLDNAMAAIHQANMILKQRMGSNPLRSGTDLAMGLAVLADLQDRQGEKDKALGSVEQALRIVEPLAEQYPNSSARRALEDLLSRDARLRRDDPSQGGRVLGTEEVLELAFLLVLDGWAAPSLLMAPTSRAMVQALKQHDEEHRPIPRSDLLDALRTRHRAAVPDPLWLGWTLETQARSLRAIRAELFGADRVREADRAVRTPEPGTGFRQAPVRRP